jgi:thiamine biosynthesis lipoprotein
MGTVVTIDVVHPDGAAARDMIASSFAEMERLEGVLSRHRPDAALAALNAAGRLVAPPAELVEVLRTAARYSALTSGAFDVTVAPLVRLYAECFQRSAAPPPEARVREALALVDFRGVRIEDEAIELSQPRMSITLDGIAKGYIVDRTVDVLVAGGAGRVLVNAGGDMASAGTGSGVEPWTVGIQDPHDPRGLVDVVRLSGACVATSGDYMRNFTEDRRFHHIVDPRTGFSPSDASSVSVLATTAMDADALSTAALVLGPTDGVALLERLDGVQGIVVTKSGEQLRTTGA